MQEPCLNRVYLSSNNKLQNAMQFIQMMCQLVHAYIFLTVFYENIRCYDIVKEMFQ